MLDLRVTAHKDGTLEVTWGLDCHETLGRGRTQVGTIAGVAFSARLGTDGEAEVAVLTA